MKRTLQVYDDGIWRYVFCRNDRQLVLTQDKGKAITCPDPAHALAYFERFFSDRMFRVAVA